MRFAVHIRWISIVSCLLLLISCGANPYKEELEKPEAGESVVFGHVDVIVDGKKQEMGQGWTGVVSCCLIILPEDSTNAVSNQINKDGMFYLSLKPGNYQLLGFRLQQGSSRRVGRIDASFTVPESQAAVYIGNITIEMRGGRYSTKVENQITTPKNAYQAKYPERTGTIATSLIKFTTRIGSYSGVAGICGSRWGIDCEGDFQGVVPMSPNGDVEQFPTINSLTPTFSWKPVKGENISYDLIIFDAATYRFPVDIGTSAEQTMKGHMVLYKEDIQNSHYKLEKPLKPKTRYFWSVRLRDQNNDIVSGWSTHSHRTFIPFVYMSSGYGAWFTFSTP
jgi:hypothetical protein